MVGHRNREVGGLLSKRPKEGSLDPKEESLHLLALTSHRLGSLLVDDRPEYRNGDVV